LIAVCLLYVCRRSVTDSITFILFFRIKLWSVYQYLCIFPNHVLSILIRYLLKYMTRPFCLFYVVYPKNSSNSKIIVTFRKMLIFLRRGVIPMPNPQAGGPPIVVRPRLLIQNIHIRYSTHNFELKHFIFFLNIGV
jgi:hypothetical protein